MAERKVRYMLNKCVYITRHLQTWSIAGRDRLANDDALRILTIYVEILEPVLVRVSPAFPDDVLHVVIAIIATVHHQADLLDASTHGSQYVVNLPTIEGMARFLAAVTILLLSIPQDILSKRIVYRCDIHESRNKVHASSSGQSTCSTHDVIHDWMSRVQDGSRTAWEKMTFESFLRQFGSPCSACIHAWTTCDLSSDSQLFASYFKPLDFTRIDGYHERTCLSHLSHKRARSADDSPTSASSTYSSDSDTLYELPPPGETFNEKHALQNDYANSLESDEFVVVDVPNEAQHSACDTPQTPPLSLDRCTFPPNDCSPFVSPAARRYARSRSRSRSRPPSPSDTDIHCSDLDAITSAQRLTPDKFLTVPRWTSGKRRKREENCSSDCDVGQSAKRPRLHSRSGSPNGYDHTGTDQVSCSLCLSECQVDMSEVDLYSRSSSELSDFKEPENVTTTSWLGRLWSFIPLCR